MINLPAATAELFTVRLVKLTILSGGKEQQDN